MKLYALQLFRRRPQMHWRRQERWIARFLADLMYVFGEVGP